MDVGFKHFFATWAVMQSWEVPKFHWQICDFLLTEDEWVNDTAVLQVFRGGSKSTILALWITWKLVCNPRLRFLIMSADHLTAQRIVRDIRQVITRHPLAKHLRGKEGTWRENRLEVLGSNDARNPSVAAHGILSNVTSARADYIVFDDVEVPKNCQTEFLREQLRTRIDETNHLLIPVTGRRLIVGTPHHWVSIYPEYIEKGATALTLPLLSNAEGEFPFIVGTSRWELRFTDDVIASRQIQSKSKGAFLSQYMLQPVRVEDSILDPSYLVVYDDEIDFLKANGKLLARIGDIELASVSAFWDVSLSKVRSDASVLALVYSDTRGHYYVHRTLPLTGEDPDEQCKQVKDYLVQFRVPVVSVECNGVGGFIPQILLKHVRGMRIGVNDVFTSTNKQQRIVENIETPLFGHFLHVHRSVLDTPFISQLRDFHPRLTNQDDDYLDSVASAIAEEPIRIGRGGNVGDGYDMHWGEHRDTAEIAVDYATLA